MVSLLTVILSMLPLNRAEIFGGSASPRLFSSAGNVLMASRKTFYEAAEEHMRALIPTSLQKVEHGVETGARGGTEHTYSTHSCTRTREKSE